MNTGWTFVQSWEVHDLAKDWEAVVVEYGFSFQIQCLEGKDSVDEWSIFAKPEDEGAYALLVNFELAINDALYTVEKDLLESECVILKEKRIHEATVAITFRFRVVDTLSSQDLTIETPYRNLELVCEGRSFFVDIGYLVSFGGKLFTDWNESFQKGSNRIVLQDLSLSDLCCLLDGTAKFRQILITRKNFDELLQIAFRFSIGQVLRAIESFLIDANWIHSIRKLEYAAVYKLARLGDCISRSLISSGRATEILHSYLADNGETLEQVHPDVLLSLNFHPGYVLV